MSSMSRQRPYRSGITTLIIILLIIAALLGHYMTDAMAQPDKLETVLVKAGIASGLFAEPDSVGTHFVHFIILGTFFVSVGSRITLTFAHNYSPYNGAILILPPPVRPPLKFS